jgi:hypothetical protein
MPDPLGEIDVTLKRVGQDGIEASITLPDGLEGYFEWQGEKVDLRSGTQQVTREAVGQ